MGKLYNHIRAAARTEHRLTSVLLTGESDAGREFIATELHRFSECNGPFIKVDCGAIREDLLEGELFGYLPKTLSGEPENRIGRFEAANGGTIFLDKINAIPLEIQPRLLQLLREQQFKRVAGSETIKINARIVAGANRDLGEDVANGTFREDLYFRLNLVELLIPSQH